jgi:hypothetical protein
MLVTTHNQLTPTRKCTSKEFVIVGILTYLFRKPPRSADLALCEKQVQERSEVNFWELAVESRADFAVLL